VIHECLNAKGSGPGCSSCPVKVRGFCDDLVIVLGKMAANLKRFRIPAADQKDILADTVEGIVKNINQFEGKNRAKFSTWAWSVYLNKRNDYFRKPVMFKITEESLCRLALKIPNEVLGALETLKDLEYETKGKFMETLEKTIGKQQMKQFGAVIARHARQPISIGGVESTDPWQEFEERTAIINLLKKGMAGEHGNCARLFLDLYVCHHQNGQKLEDLAAVYNISYDNLKQRIHRCRPIIRRMMESEGWH